MEAATLHRPESLESASSVEGEFTNNQKYERRFGTVSLILLGAGNTIGAGIFAYTGLAAKYAGGAAAWIAYVIAGASAFITALVYAEFGSRIPKSGSSYLYAQVYQGEFISWIVGWGLSLRYAGMAAPVARAWTSYMVKILKFCGVHVPIWANNYEIWGCNTSVIAPIFMLGCTVIHNRGTASAAGVTNVLTILKLCLLCFIIIVSFCNFNYEKNFTPLIEPDLGWRGVVIGATKVFFAYVGFDFLTALSEETVDPARDMPPAIMGTVALSALLYCLTAFSVNGVGNIATAITKNGGDPSTALADVFSDAGMRGMSIVISVAAVLGLAAVALSDVMGQARVLRSFGKDGLLPEIFAYMDPVTKVPTKAAWISSIVAAAACGLLNLDTLSTLSSVGNLITYALINVAVIQMRLQDAPRLHRAQYSKNRDLLTRIAPPIFFVLCSISAAAVAADWPPIILHISVGLVIINYIVIQVLVNDAAASQNLPQNGEGLLPAAAALSGSVIDLTSFFHCPLVPLLPCCGIQVNLILCSVGANPLVWKLFIAFEIIGILLYVCYGQWHSKLAHRIERHERRQSEARSIAESSTSLPVI